jgi:hypothetical protein
MTSLATGSNARTSADRQIAAIQHDPSRRLSMAADFYSGPLKAYARGELRFLRWQVARGVLDAKSGSPWWRAVSDGLQRDKQEASLLYAAGSGTPSTPAVGLWLEFLATPSAVSWYRAHNRSVVAGYLDRRELAERESAAERFLMNVTLARVLFAHMTIEQPAATLGRFATLGPYLGDPRSGSVGLFLDLHDVFPQRYPLGPTSIEQIVAGEGRMARIVDYGLILQKLDLIYEMAARTLCEPRIADLSHNGVPIYANTPVRRDQLQPDTISRIVAKIARPCADRVDAAVRRGSTVAAMRCPL